MQVLLIDDDAVMRRLLGVVLRKRGHDVTPCGDAESALREYQRTFHPIVLLDWMLPGVDGLELCRLMRATPEGDQSVIVLLTALDHPEDLTVALEAGVDDYYKKPIDVDSLSIRLALAERTARLRQERYAVTQERDRFFTLSLDMFCVVGIDGSFLQMNDACERILGYTSRELTGTPLFDLVHPDDLPATREHWQPLLAGETAIAFENRLRCRDGGHRWLTWSARAVIEEAKCYAVARDISSRKRDEEALRASEVRFRQLAEHVPGAFWMSDPAVERFSFLCPSFAGLLGEREAASLSGLASWIDLVHADDRHLLESVLASEPPRLFDLEYRIPRPDGTIGWIRNRSFPIQSAGGQVASVGGFVEDITDWKNSESSRMQTQKLESIGQLAAGIAHEINTPTQYIGDNTRFLQDAFADIAAVQEKQRELLDAVRSGGACEQQVAELEQLLADKDLDFLTEEIGNAIAQTLEGVDRVSKIVSAMREFSHPGSEDKSTVDINAGIESTIIISRNEWKYVADVETDLDRSLPPVACYPDQLNQVILNLLVNAAHAIASEQPEDSNERGRIRIVTRHAGDAVEIRVSDTGSGIPEEIRERVFDPFFTTKEVGKGTGQGLALAHSVIVDKHGGAITLESELHKGTTFRIRLPIPAAAGGVPGVIE